MIPSFAVQNVVPNQPYGGRSMGVSSFGGRGRAANSHGRRRGGSRNRPVGRQPSQRPNKRPVMPAPAPVPVVVPAPPSPPVIKQNPVPPRKPGYGGMIGFLRGGGGRTGLLSTLY